MLYKKEIFDKSKKGSTLSELYNSFYDFFYRHEKNEKKADLFAKKMEKLFRETGVHNFVTLCVNLDDGIGDYTSQVYFIEKLNNLLQGVPNATLNNISIISDFKLKISKFVRENKIPEESVTILDNQADSLDYKSCPNIIGTPKTALQKEKLHELIQEANFLFNLALPLVPVNDKLCPGFEYNFRPCNEFEITIPNKDVFIESWRAYQFKTDPYKEAAIEYPVLPVFKESSMGMHKDQKGIRFIDKIASTTKEERHTLLSSLSKKFIDEMAIPAHESFKIYAEKNSFVIGYLQDKSSSIGFVNLACQMSPKEGDLNVLLNLDYFKQVENETKFIENLRALGFTQIHIPGLDKSIHLTEAKEKVRTLRLLDFKGISDTDKNCFYRLAEMISASGDNSLSDLISAGVSGNDTVPFIQPFLTSKDICLFSLIYEVNKLQNLTEESHAELIKYLEFLYFNVRLESVVDGNKIHFEYDVEKVAGIKKNRKKIADSWHKFCCFIYENRNENNNFNELIVRYTFHHLLKNDCFDECIEMAAMLSTDSLKNISLLDLAVKLNKVAFVKQLINLESINSVDRYRALTIARYYASTEISGLLVKNWPDQYAGLHNFIMVDMDLIGLLKDLPENCRYEIACEFKKLIDSQQIFELALMELPGEDYLAFICEQDLQFCKYPSTFKLILQKNSEPEFLNKFLDVAIKKREIELASLILNEMPLERRFELTLKVVDFIEMNQLDMFLTFLPSDCHLKFISETKAKKHFRGSYPLSCLISKVPEESRFDFCCELMPQAEVDNSYDSCAGRRGCELIIEELPKNRRLEFALMIVDKLEDLAQAESIISLIPESDRYQFSLKVLDSFQDLTELYRIFDVLPEGCRLEFALETMDKIRGRSEFCKILEELPENQYTEFSDTASRLKNAQAFMNVFYISALLTKLRNARPVHIFNEFIAKQYSREIVEIFLSANPAILQIAPDFIRNQFFENAHYLRQVATICIFLRANAPALLDSRDHRLAISNVANYSTTDFDAVLKLCNYFAANEALTQENFNLICINPQGLKIPPDSVQRSCQEASNFLAKQGLFSKITLIENHNPLIPESEEPVFFSIPGQRA